MIRVTLQENTYQINREGIVLASELSLAEIGELFFLLESSDAEFASDDGVKVDCKAVEESLDYYGTKLKTPRAEAETTLDYFQRLSLLVFYEPHRLTETGSTISTTWAVWAEKFFVHGCIAYLLYLQQALAADSSDKQDLQMSNAAAIEGNILMAHENLLHNIPPTQAALKATESVEPATRYVGRAKCRWSVINPPLLRSNKAPCTPNKATNKVNAATRPVKPCAPGPESVAALRAPKHRPHGVRTTKTDDWFAMQTSSKGALVPQKASILSPVEKIRAVTAIYPSQGTAARKWVPANSNPRPNPSKRVLQRLRTTQERKRRERLHGRRHPGSLYRTGALLTDPSRAVVMYARLLAHNRRRRRSVADQDKEAEVVAFDRCINVPVMDVSTVYGNIYYAYYGGKRDEYSRVPAGIG